MSNPLEQFFIELKINESTPEELKKEHKKQYLKTWASNNADKIKEYRNKWRTENEKKPEFKRKLAEKKKFTYMIEKGDFIVDFEYEGKNDKKEWEYTGNMSQIYD